MQVISSYPASSNYIQVEGFDQLGGIVDRMADTICDSKIIQDILIYILSIHAFTGYKNWREFAGNTVGSMCVFQLLTKSGFLCYRCRRM